MADFPFSIEGVRLATAARLPQGSLRRRFAESSFWSLCAAVLSRGATLITWIACARLVSQRDFGELTLIYGAVISGGVLAAFGVGTTTTRYVAELRLTDPARAGRIIRLSAVLSAVLGALLAGGLVLFASPIARHVLHDQALASSIVLAAGLVILNASNSHQLGTLAGLEAFKDLTRLSLWTGLAGCIICVVATMLAGIRGTICGLVISQAGNWLLTHIVLKRRAREAGIPQRAPGWWREIRVLYAFSLPAVLTSTLSGPIAMLMLYWLSRLPDGFNQLALYAAADRWRLAILFLPTSLLQAELPILANLAGDGAGAQFRKVVRANALLALAIVGGAAVICPLVGPFAMGIFGRSYRAGSTVLLLLCISAIPQVLNGVLGQAVVTRSMWARFGFDVLLFSIFAGCARVLIPSTGATGLAGAYALAFAITTSLLLVYVRKHQLA